MTVSVQIVTTVSVQKFMTVSVRKSMTVSVQFMTVSVQMFITVSVLIRRIHCGGATIQRRTVADRLDGSERRSRPRTDVGAY